jgi:hypothetical protein
LSDLDLLFLPSSIEFIVKMNIPTQKSSILLLALCLYSHAITYDHNATLSDGYYTLYWSLSTDKIFFKTETKCTGWVGLGISEQGYMAPNSDVVLLFILPNTNGTLLDCFTLKHKQPPLDTSLVDEKGKRGTNDWHLTYAREVNGISTFEFYRYLDTNDSFDHVIDPSAKTNVIWSYNLDTKPTQNEKGYKFQQHDDMHNIILVLKE